MSDAQFTMEEIKRLAYDNIDGFVPEQLNNLPGEVITVEPPVDISYRVKEVTVTVDWNEKQRQRTYQLTTRFAR